MAEQKEQPIAPQDYPTTHADLREWLAKQAHEDDTFTTYVYRRNPINKKVKDLVRTYHEECPDEDTVGMTFGAGTYVIMLVVPETDNRERKIKQVTYNIAKEYDTYRTAQIAAPAAPGMQQAPLVAGQQGFDQSAMFAQTLGLIKSVVEIMAPMMRPQDSGNGGAAIDASMGDIMTANYKQMNSVFREQSLSQVHFMNDIMRQAANLPAPADIEEGDGQPTWLKSLMPVVESILPRLLGKPQESKDAAATVKALPLYQSMIKNKQALRAVLDCVESKHGKDSVEEIVNRLGIKRP